MAEVITLEAEAITMAAAAITTAAGTAGMGAWALPC